MATYQLMSHTNKSNTQIYARQDVPPSVKYLFYQGMYFERNPDATVAGEQDPYVWREVDQNKTGALDQNAQVVDAKQLIVQTQVANRDTLLQGRVMPAQDAQVRSLSEMNQEQQEKNWQAEAERRGEDATRALRGDERPQAAVTQVQGQQVTQSQQQAQAEAKARADALQAGAVNMAGGPMAPGANVGVTQYNAQGVPLDAGGRPVAGAPVRQDLAGQPAPGATQTGQFVQPGQGVKADTE
jgi:hypothetical protein